MTVGFVDLHMTICYNGVKDRDCCFVDMLYASCRWLSGVSWEGLPRLRRPLERGTMGICTFCLRQIMRSELQAPKSIYILTQISWFQSIKRLIIRGFGARDSLHSTRYTVHGTRYTVLVIREFGIRGSYNRFGAKNQPLYLPTAERPPTVPLWRGRRSRGRTSTKKPDCHRQEA